MAAQPDQQHPGRHRAHPGAAIAADLHSGSGAARCYDTFAAELYAYAWTLLGPGDGPADAVRTALLAAARLADALTEPDALRPWLFALVRTACRQTGFAAQSPYAALPTAPAERSAAALLAELPPSSRELLELSLRHGLSAASIGRVLGFDAETASGLCRAAELRAADLLKEHGTADAADAADASATPPAGPAAAEDTGAHAAPNSEEPYERPAGHDVSGTAAHANSAGQTDEPNPPQERGPLADPTAVLARIAPPGPPSGLRERTVAACSSAEAAAERAQSAALMRPLGDDGFPLHRGRSAADQRTAAHPQSNGAQSAPELSGQFLDGDRITTGDTAAEPRAEQRVLLSALMRRSPSSSGAGAESRAEGGRTLPWAAVSGLATVAAALALSMAAVLNGGVGRVTDSAPPPSEYGAPAADDRTVALSPSTDPGDGASAGPESPRALSADPQSPPPSAAPEPGPDSGADASHGPGTPTGAPQEPGTPPADPPADPPAEDPPAAPPEGEDPPEADDPERPRGPVTRLLEDLVGLIAP